MRLKIHPVAEIFPLMGADEFERFCADIQHNGLREDIWTWQGAVIDGRNRLNACLKLDIEPRFREWSGQGELTAFVVSLNLHRRHLSESQRTMVAAKIANMAQGERTDLSEPSANLPKVSQTEAARLLNVSPRSVTSAKKILKDGVSELAEQVEQGKMSVNQAVQIAELPKGKQIRIIRRGREQGRKILNQLKTQSLKQTVKNYDSACLLCNTEAVATKDSVSALMQLLAVKHPKFARYFAAVTDELEELELADDALEAKEKILCAIKQGFQTAGEICLTTKLDSAIVEYTISILLDYNEITAIEQGGKTEVARGARKILYQLTEESYV